MLSSNVTTVSVTFRVIELLMFGVVEIKSPSGFSYPKPGDLTKC